MGHAKKLGLLINISEHIMLETPIRRGFLAKAGQPHPTHVGVGGAALWPWGHWVQRYAHFDELSIDVFPRLGWRCAWKLNRKYRFAFLVSAKTGSTAAVRHLEDLLCASLLEQANGGQLPRNCSGVALWDD